jgi:H+-transporting ATPase
LFYLGERVFKLDRAHIQTMMYLKLSVAGHLTIFLTRTRGPFWSIRPAKILWIAVVGTQILATLIAVYGFFMTPLGWGWALFVWGYALAWFLLNDRVKLLAYRIFDCTKAGDTPEERAQQKSKAKAGVKPDSKPEPKREAPGVAPDLAPRVAKRAYELYEKRGRKGDLADQDWQQATREIGKDDTENRPEPDANNKAKPSEQRAP